MWSYICRSYIETRVRRLELELEGSPSKNLEIKMPYNINIAYQSIDLQSHFKETKWLLIQKDLTVVQVTYGNKLPQSFHGLKEQLITISQGSISWVGSSGPSRLGSLKMLYGSWGLICLRTHLGRLPRQLLYMIYIWYQLLDTGWELGWNG